MRVDNKQTLFISVATILLLSLFIWTALRDAHLTGTAQVAVDRLIGRTYKVNHIGVISGHEFDIKLESGKRIHALLDVITAPEARDEVVRVLNKAQDPHVRLIGRDESNWHVELYFRIDGSGREINFSDWLRQQGLVWD